MHGSWAVILLAAAAAGVPPLQSDQLASTSGADRTAKIHDDLNLGAAVPAGVHRWRFREGFNQQSISPQWRYEMEDVSRLQIVADPVRSGLGSAQFTLRPEDDHAGGNRSELKLFLDDGLGSVTWCSWSFLIPTDFVDTPDESGHQIIGQWHDRPPAGVSWADYTNHTPLTAVKYVANEGWSEIRIVYGLDGINKQLLAIESIEKGRWVDLVFRIRWSMGGDGYIEVWKDGVPVTAFNGQDYKVYGPNMYNETPPFFKIGLYRAPGFTTTNSIYFDEVRVGRTFADIAPL